MEKKEYLRKEFNLTQEEMAILLKTKRSQLALYEKGLRELPATALIRSSEIALFMVTAKAPEAKHFPQVIELEEEKEKFLKKALEDCQYYQMGFNRKIPKMEEDYKATLKLLQLIPFLENPTNENDALHPGAILILKDKAQKSLEKNGPQELIKLKLQLQLLQAEEALLKNLIESSKVDKQELE